MTAPGGDAGRRQRRLVPLRRGRRRHRHRLIRQRARRDRGDRTRRSSVTGRARSSSTSSTSNGERVQWKDLQNFTPFIEGLVPERPRVHARRCATSPTPTSTRSCRSTPRTSATSSSRPPSASRARTTSRTSTRRSRRSSTPGPCASTRPSTSRRACTAGCSSGRRWVQYVGGDNRCPNNNEFFFNWNPDDQTFGRSGIHHNILGGLQLHDHRRHRRPPAAPRRPARAVADRRRLRPLRDQQPALPRPRPDARLGSAGRRAALRGRPRGLLRRTSTASASSR